MNFNILDILHKSTNNNVVVCLAARWWKKGEALYSRRRSVLSVESDNFPGSKTTPPVAAAPLPHTHQWLQYPIQSAETFNVPRNRGLVFFTDQSVRKAASDALNRTTWGCCACCGGGIISSHVLVQRVSKESHDNTMIYCFA